MGGRKMRWSGWAAHGASAIFLPPFFCQTLVSAAAVGSGSVISVFPRCSLCNSLKRSERAEGRRDGSRRVTQWAEGGGKEAGRGIFLFLLYCSLSPARACGGVVGGKRTRK